MSDEKRGTSRQIGAVEDTGSRRRRGRTQHLQQPRRHQVAEGNKIGRRWRRYRAAQIAVFAGVSGRQAGGQAGGRARARIVQAYDGERVDAVLRRRESRTDAGQKRMHGDRVDRHPAQYLPAQTHLGSVPLKYRSLNLPHTIDA